MLFIKELLVLKGTGQKLTIQGWVRTFRNNQFIAINDGSCIGNIQAVIDLNDYDESTLKKINPGTAIEVSGALVESMGKGQNVEIKVDTLKIHGESNPELYPLQPKKHSLEFLRDIAHLRFRTSTFGSVFRIRHALSFALHQFFNDKGFVYLHSPIVTGSDAEGAGELFQVT